MTNIAKKFFAFAAALALVGSLVPATAFAAVHAAGTNVNSNGTIWFVDNAGQRRAYTSAGAFLSYGFNSWSGVVTASAEDMALPAGSFVAPMPGSLINDNGTVYLMVDAGNGVVTRSGFTTPGNFLGLGYSWSNVMAGDTSFLAANAPINSTAMAHPAGTLVNQDGTVYLMTPSGKMGIPSLEVFNSWGFSFSKVVVANSHDRNVSMSSGIMAARVAGQLYPSQGTTPVPSGSVSVGLAASNPAASTIASDSTNGQKLVNLADFAFSGSGVVTNVVVKRIGVSADATLENVYLFDGSTRLTDGAAITSGSMATFSSASGLFTVNGSKTISVRADIDDATTASGQTVGIQLASAMTGSTAVSGTPVSGNVHTIASATLATIAMTAPTDSGDVDPGTDVLVWQGTGTVSTRDVLLTRLALRQVGSIASADINNFKFYIDGALVSTVASLDANGYVTFSVSKALTTGAHTLKVTADVIGGSDRTVEMSLRGTYDLNATDTQYNANAVVTLSTTPFDSDGFTVNDGTLTVVKASDSQSANVTVGGTDVSVGKWTMTAYGEPIKVETLTVGVDTNGTDADNTFRNVRILVNGAQVGSTTNVAAVNSYASGSSFSTNFTVNPGSPATVEVRADMYDSEGTNDIAAGTTTTAQFALVAGSANGRQQVSLGTVDVPTASVPANSLTIASGTMSIAKTSNYGNQTIVAPQTAYKVGSFVVSGSSTEVINLNTIEIDFTDSADLDASDDLTNVYVVYGGSQTTVKGTVADTDNTWSINRALGVNESMSVDVYATVASTVSAADTVRADITLTGVTAQSGQTVYADVDNTAATTKDAGFQGQTITVGSGSITVSKDATSPDSQLVDDGTTVTTAAFKFAAVNDAYTITDIVLTLADASVAQTVTLKDGGTAVTGGSKPAAATVTFSGLSIAVPANTDKVITVDLALGSVGSGAGTSGASILTTLTSATARNSQGTSAAVTEATANPAGNVMYVYKAIPTVSLATTGMSTVLTNGTASLVKFQVNTNGTGTVAWKQVALTINKTGDGTDGAGDAPVLTSFSLWDADTNTEITAAKVIASDGAVTTNCDEDASTCTVRISVGTDADDNVERQVSGAKTYEVRASVTGTLATGDYVSTNIARPSSHITSDVYATANDNTPSFVWSDVSAQSHDTGTADWSNDNLVRVLPTSTFTLTK